MTKSVVEISLGSREVHADFLGFRALAKLNAELELHANERVHVDCKDLRWFDAQLGAVLHTVVSHAQQRGSEILLKNLPKSIRAILRKNGTLKEKMQDTYRTTIKVTKFKLDEEVRFASFVKDSFTRKNVPEMGESLARKFFEGLDELFANCSLHSKSLVPVFAGGQFFPTASKLCFTLSDGGRGIHGSLKAAGKHFDEDKDAVAWAMEKTHSARAGDIPGGLGLWILQEFVAMNGGRLVICSHEGYWEKKGNEFTVRRLGARFPGTVASLEINTADRHKYELDELVSPTEIW